MSNITLYLNYMGTDWSDSAYTVLKTEQSGNTEAVVFQSTNDGDGLYSSQNGLINSIAVSATGVVVVVIAYWDNVSPSGGIKANRSLDWGETWEGLVEVCQSSPATYVGMESVMVDTSNNFYVLANISAQPFYLWKSTDNGGTWAAISTVPVSPAFPSHWLAGYITGTRIYAMSNKVGVAAANLWYSDDSGANWTNNSVSIAGESYLDDFAIAANGAVVICICVGRTTGKTYLLRSEDSGANWVTIGQIDPVLTWPLFAAEGGYYSLRNSGETFVFTACGNYKTDTDYLAYLKSIDNGLTWAVEELPYSVSGASGTLG